MPDARDRSIGPFVHLVDRFGSCRSICRVCFQTVAQDPKENQLFAREQQHECPGPPRPLSPRKTSAYGQTDTDA